MLYDDAVEIIVEEAESDLESLYLGGSRAFGSDIEGSDRDLFGFVADSFENEREEDINDKLEKVFEDEVNFRAIYLSELNGEHQRGTLTNYIPVEVLIKSFPFWKHIYGKHYSLKDFEVKPATATQEIDFYIDRLSKFREQAENENLPFDFEDYVKTVLLFIGAIQQAEQGEDFTLDYKEIADRSNGGYGRLAKLCLRDRNGAHMNREEFFELLDELLEDYN